MIVEIDHFLIGCTEFGKGRKAHLNGGGGGGLENGWRSLRGWEKGEGGIAIGKEGQGNG